MEGLAGKVAKFTRALALFRLGARTPLFVSHYCTYRCNFSCKYCGLWRARRKELPTKQILALVDGFASAGCVSWSLTGGEPLLRMDVGKIIGRAKKKGMAVSLNTNGSLLPARLDDCEGLDLVSVSIDGPEKLNDALRGRGSFRLALAGAIAARDAGLPVSIMSVLSPATMADNCRGVREAISLAKKLRVRIAFQPLYSDSYTSGAPHNPLAPLDQNYREAISTIKKEKTENPGLVKMSGAYLERLANPRPGPCVAGRLFCAIFPDGLVAPCFPLEKAGRRGALAAFRKLPLRKSCLCYFNCFSEWNSLLSLSPAGVAHYISNYF